MINYGRVKSLVRPQETVIDENSIWLNTEITEVEEINGNESFNGWEFNQIRYTKDEYILLLKEKNSQIEAQMTDAQLALCEIYELIGG